MKEHKREPKVVFMRLPEKYKSWRDPHPSGWAIIRDGVEKDAIEYFGMSLFGQDGWTEKKYWAHFFEDHAKALWVMDLLKKAKEDQRPTAEIEHQICETEPTKIPYFSVGDIKVRKK